MKKLLLVTNLVTFSILAFGQNNTYFGAEVGPVFDIYQYADNGTYLYTDPIFYNPIVGVKVERDLNETFSVGTGFYLHTYGDGYKIRGMLGQSISNAITATQIPLRLNARLKLVANRLDFVTTLGFTYGYNTNYNSAGSGFGSTTNTDPSIADSIRTEYNSTYSLKRSFGLLESGIGLDYHLKNDLALYVAANYLTGFNRLIQLDVKYWIDDQPEQTGTVFSNGDYFSVVFGAKYPISRIWNSAAN